MLDRRLLGVIVLAGVVGPAAAAAQTSIRIMPPEGATVAVGQRFDLRVEATAIGAAPPRGLSVSLDGRDATAQNILDPGAGGERGAGGTGATGTHLSAAHRASGAPPNTTNLLIRDLTFAGAGDHVIVARTADGAEARVRVSALEWQAGRAGAAVARNIILLLGDGMGAAHRTAARVVSRGLAAGKPKAPLAMDTMEVTGLVMTAALNAVITDSAPGMSAYVNGQKGNNNQAGVYPDNTRDVFDNPRAEYLGALLRRTRGQGFHVGIVTTADVTDATPTGNAVYTADRDAWAGIAARYLEERETNGVAVLMGGGARGFTPGTSARTDDRDLAGEFARAGFARITTAMEVRGLLERAAGAPGPDAVPAQLLGLFHTRHMPVAFDKVGAGRYSEELGRPANGGRDQPMLEELTRLALASLSRHSPQGFYLMVEGASIDKQAHDADAERTIWDTIEFDNAVGVALEFAARTNGDDDPSNDTLVLVTADHETGGLALIGVGNERYAPARLGAAVRDYAAVYRFLPEQVLGFFTNYEADASGYPIDPDPAKKLLLGWAAAPDRYENWVSKRKAQDAAVLVTAAGGDGRPTQVAVANPARSGSGPDSDNRTVQGVPIPGFLVPGAIENGATGCPGALECPADTAARPNVEAGHTGTDVPLSASGAGAWQFTGTFDNTDVFIRMLRAAAGSYPVPGSPTPRGR